MGDVDGMDRVDVNVDALKSEIRRAIVNQKANAYVHILMFFIQIIYLIVCFLPDAQLLCEWLGMLLARMTRLPRLVVLMEGQCGFLRNPRIHQMPDSPSSAISFTQSRSAPITPENALHSRTPSLS